jgi:hypothetical protein
LRIFLASPHGLICCSAGSEDVRKECRCGRERSDVRLGAALFTNYSPDPVIMDVQTDRHTFVRIISVS